MEKIKDGELNLNEIKKIANDTKNKELAIDLKKRIKNNKTVEKWQK
jgi:hypothetical protein